MITDPVNVRAKQPGATNYRIFRGAVVAGVSFLDDDAVGHQRDTEHPKGLEGFSENHGLRLSQTLSPTLRRSAP